MCACPGAWGRRVHFDVCYVLHLSLDFYRRKATIPAVKSHLFLLMDISLNDTTPFRNIGAISGKEPVKMCWRGCSWSLTYVFRAMMCANNSGLKLSAARWQASLDKYKYFPSGLPNYILAETENGREARRRERERRLGNPPQDSSTFECWGET